MIDRRKLISIGLIGLPSVALSACSLVKKQKVEYYREDGYGVIDSNGTWVIEPRFNQISIPVKGLCIASPSRNDAMYRVIKYCVPCGIVDLSGEWVIEPKWKDTGGLSELDYFGAQDAESGRWGIARKDGSWQVEPYLVGKGGFSGIGYFNPHTQIAKAYDEASDLWGFIDGSGKWVVKPFTKEINYVGDDKIYAASPADSALYGLIDIEGSWIAEPKFFVCGAFGKTGYADAILDETKRSGLIDKQGNWVVEPKFFGIRTPNKSNFIPAKGCTERSSEDLFWGFIDLSGEWVVEPKYLDIGSYNEKCDVASVRPKGKDGCYRLMNSKEEFVSDVRFSYIFPKFSDEGYCYAIPYKLKKPSEE